MVAEFVSVVGATVPTIPEGNLVPGTVRGIAQCSIVLRSADYPLILTLEVNDEFELRNAESRIERLPVRAAIRRSEHTTVVARVKDVGVGRIKRKVVLIRMNRVAGVSSRDVLPIPT